MFYRAETNDRNTLNASMTEDEYGLRGLSFSGLAIDIGGYLGSVAIGLLLDNPNLRVECVEPIPENIDLIKRNAAMNGVSDRLYVHECAVGDGTPVTIRYAYQGGENELHHAYVGNGNTTSGAGDMPHTAITVPSLTVADFGPASLVKIDCEGGEFAFFASGDTSKFQTILGEWHPVDGHTGTDLFDLLPEHDITFTGPESGPAEFRAVLRPHAGES
jgi:FkbM family methyltransferase